MSEIITRLENANIRFGTENEIEAKIRRNKAIEDAITVIARLEAEKRERSEYLVGVIEERERLRRAVEEYGSYVAHNGNLQAINHWNHTFQFLERNPEPKPSDKILALLDDRKEAYIKHGLREEDLP